MKNKLKKTTAFILLALMIFTLLPAQPSIAFLGPSVTLGSPNLTDGKYYYESAVVEGSIIRTILINFSDEVTSGDAITLPTAPAGFTVSGSSNDYTKRINIDPMIETSVIQSYLRGVGFSLGSESQTVQVVVSSEDIQYDTYYNSVTQHYYQFIPLEDADETWITSYNAAKGMTYMGRTGYLATVTSLQEDSFIMELSGEVGWLGGTRMGYNSGADSFSSTTTTVYWYWACGPEKGSHFYDAQYVTISDYATKDTDNAAYYFNWNRPASGAMEPNSNLAGGETCLTTLHIGTGYAGTTGYSWNDRDYDANYWDDITSVYQPHGYVVEYGNQGASDGWGDSGSGNSAFASASGALSAPCEISLGDPTFFTDTYYSFSGLTLTSPNNIGVVTIHADKAAASSNTIMLPVDGETPGGAPNVITDLNDLTMTIVFTSAQSAADVQAYLRAVVFTASPSGAQTVTITADANTTTGMSSDMKLTAFNGHPDGTTHYYVYVSSSPVTWADAYNAAKSLKFMGMTGYLPTITSPGENTVLTNISAEAAWSGGTRLVFNGNNSTTDNAQICDQSTLIIDSFTKADTDEKEYFYWACGPEAGLTYCIGRDWEDAGGVSLVGNAFYTAFSGSAWGANQPDNYAYGESTTEPCMQVNQQNTVSGSTVYLWNDLPLFRDNGDDELRYYFVEFGGYTGSTDSIKQFANDPGGPNAFLTDSASAAVTASYSITYNLDGGTNPAGAPVSYIYGTGAALPTPTKAGYTFDGWYTDTGFTGSAVTTIDAAVTGAKVYFAKWTAAASYGGGSPSKTITVTETSSELFAGGSGAVLAEANVDNAFSDSVEVKVTDTGEDTSSFGFGAGTDVYPFDISLYIKGTNTKTMPASGYSVTISLPIPEDLLDVRGKLFIVHKAGDGAVTRLTSSLKQIGGVWYLIFDATEFSPYALVVSNLASYNTAAGLPYYLDESGSRMFIGFSADGKYLAPHGATVLFMPNPKSFTDISSHWGKTYIDFATEREIFVGTGADIFSPDTGMTRAMIATVIGRLYERSYGKISASDTFAFTDCNYNDYYGKYVDWAAENDIILGVGGDLFQPDRQVSRQEMAAMLYRFAKFTKLTITASTDAELNYSDASSIASWAEDAALYCRKTGIITGRAGASFAPTETATRAEVATIIQRFVELALN